MRTVHIPHIVLLLCFSYPVFAQDENRSDATLPDATLTLREHTESLIRQLGDDSYANREAAYEKLRQSGPAVFFYLQAAVKDKDVEIAERVKELLQYVEPGWISSEDDKDVKELMQRYTDAETVEAKIELIGRLTDWEGDFFANGRGIGALCRILLYEHEPLVRAEAAREIIAVPPLRYTVRQKWFESASELLTGVKNDMLVDMTVFFAKTRAKAIAYREKTMFQDNPESPGDELVQDARTLGDMIKKFRDHREYYEGRRGTNTDILLFYALAEVYDALQMEHELNDTLYKALDVIAVMTEEGISPYASHWLAAKYLELRDLAQWAKNEYTLVLKKEPRFEASVLVSLSFLNVELDNLLEAAEQLEAAIEAIADPMSPRNDFTGNVGMLRARHKYMLAKTAFDNDKIEDAKKYLDEAAVFYPDEADCLILRYKIGLKDRDHEFQKKTDELMKHSLSDLNLKMRSLMNFATPNKQYSLPYNQAAWLLANTGGDYAIALPAAKKALDLDPEYPGVLDTLGHAYLLGEEYDLAIETQKTAVMYAPQVKVFRDVLKRFEEAKRKSLELE